MSSAEGGNGFRWGGEWREDLALTIFIEFSRAADLSLADGKVDDYDIVYGHDVHLFARRGSVVLHVQGYPGMTESGQYMLSGRLMDHDRLQAVRQRGDVSIGNEHEAVTDNNYWPQGLVEFSQSSQTIDELIDGMSG